MQRSQRLKETVQIVCDSQAAFDLKKGMLAFIYNMYIQACASNESICFDRKYIFFYLLESYGSGFHFKDRERL